MKYINSLNLEDDMMKNSKKLAALALSLAMTGSLAACGGNANTPGSADDNQSAGIMYAVEAGSAGEAIAKENGYTYNAVSSQADALMEVASGTSEAAIIDLLMAGAMIGEGTSYPDLTYTDRLTEEEYGVGCRQDSDLTIISILFSPRLTPTAPWLPWPTPMPSPRIFWWNRVNLPSLLPPKTVTWLTSRTKAR